MLYASIVFFVSFVVQTCSREPIINKKDRIEHSAYSSGQRATGIRQPFQLGTKH